MSTDIPASSPSADANSRKAKIQVIARAASVLRALEHEPDGLSLGAIAQRLKLPRSTIQRIVGALEAENLLIAASPMGRVKLGPALLRLSASVQNPVSSFAKSHMADIARDLSEAVDLSVMGRTHAILIEQTMGAHRMHATAAIAEKFPLHCTASGKAMLALLTDTEVEQKIGRSYTTHTEHTRTTLDALLPDLHEAQRTGLAYDLEEHALGVCGVAVGFKDALGNRLALSVSGASSRFNELKPKAEARLLELRNLLIEHFSSK